MQTASPMVTSEQFADLVQDRARKTCTHTVLRPLSALRTSASCSLSLYFREYDEDDGNGTGSFCRAVRSALAHPSS
ncbi:hypothetical protein PM082_022007 [Marasmius tenuissimus]|nr:hypothetical protein PM082_022007 [Marasmius tenuissimus]